jgi:hypothetical protein
VEKEEDRVDPFVLSKKLQWFLFEKQREMNMQGREKEVEGHKKRNGGIEEN